MKKVNIPCLIMLCTNKTENECIKKSLFADREWRLPYLKSVKPGDIAFLMNITKDELLGTFITESSAKFDIELEAFNGEFPAQIKVKLIGQLQRINDASRKLENIIMMKEIRKKSFSYKIPLKNTYGPDVTNQILMLFSNTDKVISYSKTMPQDNIGFLPEYTLEDVAGLDKVKDFIYQRIIAPFEDEEAAYKLGLRIGGGFLLVGPPGTGKTLIAMAIANHIQAKFVDLSPSVIIGYPGEAERRIENIFASLEKEPRAIVFFDEAEWVLCRRNEQTSSVMQRFTPHLLSQLSKIFKQKSKPIIIIAATNRPDMIDPAFLRPGRFDRIFYAGLPKKAAREKMIKIFLKNRENKLTEKDICELAEKLKGFSGADIEAIIEEAAYIAFCDKSHKLITKAIILTAIKSRQKSVTPEEVVQIEQWLHARNIKF